MYHFNSNYISFVQLNSDYLFFLWFSDMLPENVFSTTQKKYHGSHIGNLNFSSSPIKRLKETNEVNFNSVLLNTKISKCYHSNIYQYKVNNEIVTFLFFHSSFKIWCILCSHSTAEIGLVKCSLRLLWWWFMVASTAQDGGSSLATEPGELLSLVGPREGASNCGLARAKNQGDQCWWPAQDIFRMLFECQSVELVLHSRSLQAERALSCALDRRMGPNVVGNWGRRRPAQVLSWL